MKNKWLRIIRQAELVGNCVWGVWKLWRIISTNLGRGELLDRYGEQTASRILGAYEPIAFFGRDIRQIKAAKRHG